MTDAKSGRLFVPAQLNVAEWSDVEPLMLALLHEPLTSASSLEAWLARFSELSSVIDEYGSRLYINKSCHTDDAAIEKAYMHFVENIEPKLKPLYFELQKKYVASPYRTALTGTRYDMLTRKWQADVETFRVENVPLETDVTRLVNDYDKISGAMTVDFDGKTLTMPQLGRVQEETDRARRQAAFEAGAKRRMSERDKIEVIFDKLLPLRQQIAHNAGLGDYRAYTWKSLKRFDYTPDDCHAFAEAIEKSIVPVVKELDRQRKNDLGVDTLRPWDLAVDPKNRAPLRPFAETEIDAFVSTTRMLFDRLSPALANEFESLRTHGNLDLESRKGKQPGGYQMSLEESKQPFIFMNAAGTQRDVETLLHEAGHAFHFIASANAEPLSFLRAAPMEFCEVASMAMEALGSEHFDLYYANPDEAARAKRTYLEGVIRFFPWMATIDQFQHWLYTHPGHSQSQRTAHWLSLLERFGSIIDYSGYEDVRASSWQRQLHLFHAPFYYVEYGIAQIGALQLWRKASEDPQRALSNYRAALKLGGTRPLPELFTTAGLRFDFSMTTIEPLMHAVHEELAALPA